MTKYCSFQNSGVFAKGYNSTAILNIRNSTFTNSKIYGFYPRSEVINVYDSSITGSTVTSDSYNKGINLFNCPTNSTNFILGCCNANISVYNSTIQNSNFSVGSGNPIGGPLNIESSLLINTRINLPSAKVNIKNSTLDNISNTNTIGNGVIECSVFNGASNITGLSITGNNNYESGFTTNISNSHFKNLNIAISLSNNSNLIVNNSNFENNTLYHIENKTPNAINAKNNYWYTNDVNIIKSKIYDYYDNINLGIIDFSGQISAPISLSSCNTFLSSDEFKNDADKNKVKIFPNPSDGNFNLVFDNLKNINIHLLDSSGKLILKKMNINETQFNIYLNQKGLYFLHVESNNYKRTFKLIVQ